MKCTACGSAVLVEGVVRDSMGDVVRFYAKDVPALKQMFYLGSKEIRAYACVHCHNLQFAVEFKESVLERYQQFEGEQPDVLERINSDPKKLER